MPLVARATARHPGRAAESRSLAILALLARTFFFFFEIEDARSDRCVSARRNESRTHTATADALEPRLLQINKALQARRDPAC